MSPSSVNTRGKSAAFTAEQRAMYLTYAGLSLPRHTSYPTAPEWKTTPQEGDLYHALGSDLRDEQRVLVYIHVPYCEKGCYYCGCNRTVLGHKSPKRDPLIESYLDGVSHEARHYQALAKGSVLAGLHLGGGTPTYLTPDELERLLRSVFAVFHPGPDAELSIEVDPRVTTIEHLRLLAKLGFRRISMGIQDFDLEVQKAAGRIQPFAMVKEFVVAARSLGFTSVNFDLIHGLPFQTVATMTETLDRVVELDPDRIAYYRLAVLPDLFKLQKLFTREALPDPSLCLDLMLLALDRLTASGYTFIGLDHFAKEHDSLAIAAKERTLRRSFQGMTTGRDLPLIGLGPTAISQYDGLYVQNFKEIDVWTARVPHGLACERGIALTDEDKLRRELLQRVYCHGEVRWVELDELFGIDSRAHFSPQIRGLQLLSEQGLVEMDECRFVLTHPLGRLLMRVVAALFDAYLPADAFQKGMVVGQASQV